jgi:branched-chain amino acid transport system substrate-binding protein
LPALVIATVALAACGSSKTASTSTTAASETGSAASTASGGFNAEALKWVEEFYGGKGAAKSSETPYKVGFVNQEAGGLTFPGAAAAIPVLEKLVNTYLGGVDGHPVQFVKCVVGSEEDGQKCGTQLLNESAVNAIVTGVLAVGSPPLLHTIGGAKPIFENEPLLEEDFTSKHVFAMNPSAYVSSVETPYIAKALKAQKVAVLCLANTAGLEQCQKITKPEFLKAGVKSVVVVPVPIGATAPTVAAALQSAGAESAQAAVANMPAPVCNPIADGTASLGIKATVVTAFPCWSPVVQEHFKGSFPENWVFATMTPNPYSPNVEDGSLTYVSAMSRFGQGKLIGEEAALNTFGGSLTALKLINELAKKEGGAEKVTAAAISTAMEAYKGRVAGIIGKEAKCGYSKKLPGLCDAYVGLWQYKGGKWSAVPGYEEFAAVPAE